jgi:hypothetical protein
MEKSFFTLLKSLLGDFDFEELRDANPYVGPALFIVFVGLAVFVLLNMLIAIISDAYAEARKEISDEDDIDLLTLIFKYLRESVHSIPVVGKFFVRGEEIAKKVAGKLKITKSRSAVHAEVQGGDRGAIDVQGTEEGGADEGSAASAKLKSGINKFKKQMTQRHFSARRNTSLSWSTSFGGPCLRKDCDLCKTRFYMGRL